MNKRFFSLFLALVMALSLSLPALAAEERGISVQLNGQMLTFTDAAPILEGGRTFLPFRAVFEAMGAEVGYDEASKTVTASRDGVSLTMVIGQRQATLAAEGVSLPIPMDVEPFVRDGRTYVPVRFAAVAFGCQVGWDQDDQTVILVDTAKVLEQIKGEFKSTWLEKYTAYIQRVSDGKWAVDGKMTGSASMSGQPVLSLDGAMKGIVDGQRAGEMTVSMNMDLTGLMNLLAAMSGVTTADMGLTAKDMKMSVAMDTRIDLEKGVLYLLPDAAYANLVGVKEGTWLSIDMNTMLGDLNLYAAGLDLEDLSGSASMELTDKDTAYETVTGALRQLYGAFSDERFQKVDGGYAATLALSQNGADMAVKLILMSDAKDEVVGYKLELVGSADLTATMTAEEKAQLAASGMDLSKLTVTLVTGMDSANRSTLVLTLDLGAAMALELSADMSYTATDKAPQTAPPAGSTVMDLLELAGMAA